MHQKRIGCVRQRSHARDTPLHNDGSLTNRAVVRQAMSSSACLCTPSRIPSSNRKDGGKRPAWCACVSCALTNQPLSKTRDKATETERGMQTLVCACVAQWSSSR
mmetsp:Transcript_22774/g.65161  ORF Transcript_22774/g.65161 Transcript_22774/m.65161 type:complete len:105 (-) Transcript_22774:297-611(-)